MLNTVVRFAVRHGLLLYARDEISNRQSTRRHRVGLCEVGEGPGCRHGRLVHAVADVRAHYKMHARTARELAEDFFDSKKVLNELLDQLKVAH